MTDRDEPSWSDREGRRTVGPWVHPNPRQDLTPLRLTPLGRTALHLAIALLLLTAFAVGFLIRTPQDRAALERSPATDMPAHNARSERTP